MSENKRLFVLSLGNLMEFYDFAVYGFLVGTLSPLFFPLENEMAQLISGFGVFSIGFLARPIGSFIFGYLGDRKGRRFSLLVSLALMGFSTTAIGFLPTYEKAGLLAPSLLVVFRLLQGLSLGGEFSGSLVTLTEQSESERKAILGCSLLTAIGVSGWLMGSLVCYAAQKMWSPDTYWRIPFLLGFVTAGIGFFLRLSLENIGVPKGLNHEERTNFFLLDLARNYPSSLISTIGIGALMGCMFYGCYIFPNSFLVTVVGMDASDVTRWTTFGIFLYMIFLPFAGLIATKITPQRLMTLSALGCLLLSYPLYGTLILWPEYIVFGEGVSALLLAGFMAPATYLMTRVFPYSNRYTGVSAGYNLGACFLGGTAPVIFTSLISLSGSHASPILYMELCALIGLISCFLIQRKKLFMKTEAI